MLIFRGVPWIHHVHSQIAKTTSFTTPRNTLHILHHHTVDGSEIPNNHLGCINLDNNGMKNYRSQLVSRISSINRSTLHHFLGFSNWPCHSYNWLFVVIPTPTKSSESPRSRPFPQSHSTGEPRSSGRQTQKLIPPGNWKLQLVSGWKNHG